MIVVGRQTFWVKGNIDGRRNVVSHHPKFIYPGVTSRHYCSVQRFLHTRTGLLLLLGGGMISVAESVVSTPYRSSRLLHQRLFSRISPLSRMFGQPLHTGYPSRP